MQYLLRTHTPLAWAKINVPSSNCIGDFSLNNLGRSNIRAKYQWGNQSYSHEATTMPAIGELKREKFFFRGGKYENGVKATHLPRF